LHVLSLPPAFVLSQDQTLRFNEIQSGHIWSRIKLDEVLIHPKPKPWANKSHLVEKRVRRPFASHEAIQGHAAADNPTEVDAANAAIIPRSASMRRPRFSFFSFTCQRTERQNPSRPEDRSPHNQQTRAPTQDRSPGSRPKPPGGKPKPSRRTEAPPSHTDGNARTGPVHA
jgi:hypothetical protein